MRIRDALESDADALAAVIDRPRGVVVDMIHDRSVRVAVSDVDRGVDTDADEPSVAGFLAFDVRGRTVHVTDFGGDEPAVQRLFEEPRRFASGESMAVEAVVPNDEDIGEIVESVGFNSVGAGPRFADRETTRYRIESEKLTD
ncbi:hypothetical protein [Halorubrum trueperi]|uniref:N-acetyltransferase domain-containing protein n=1 Tax=Halorubrum trueperi TaxID=2004704 RepID=A0ABD5UMR8_9EURY